jgi:hypothetical protein
VNVKPIAALMARLVPDQKEELTQAENAANGMIGLIRGAGVSDVYAVATLGGRSMIPMVFLVVPDSPQLNALALTKVLNLGGLDGGAGSQGRKVGNAYVLPLTTHLQPLPEEFHPVDRPELREGLAATGKAAVQLVLIPPDSTRRVIEELMPKLPDEIGGRSTTVLTRGLRWAALTGEMSPQLAVRLTIKSQDAAAAEALRSQCLDLIALARRDKEVRRHLPEFEKAAKLFTPTLSGDRLTVNITESDVAESGLMAPIQQAVDKARESARRAVSMNHLKQIGLAMHNYYGSGKNHFPAAAIRARDGKPLVSWRVAILPYLSEEKLYSRFHLDEPWDSPHNKPLIDKIPEIFRDGYSKAEGGRTRYLAPVGGGAFYSTIDEEPKINQISDGTSHTFMLVEVNEKDAAIWTKPDDLAFDPKDPKKGLGEGGAGGFGAAFCDGSVRFIPSKVDPNTLKALFTRAGGDVIGDY